MSQARKSGDWVVTKRRTGSLQRGDIVVFDDPTGTGMSLVKRVIGVPGETIGIENGRVTINGILLADRWANGVTGPSGDWQIPDDHIWVLGDNRTQSRSDGRLFGPTPIGSVYWQVVARYWPSTKVGMIQ